MATDLASGLIIVPSRIRLRLDSGNVSGLASSFSDESVSETPKIFLLSII